MKKHELKLDTKYFEDVKSGKNNFEIRDNDRGFEIGDIFKPEEINQDLKIVNGREYVMNLHISLFLKCVSNVLKKYFNTDKVQDTYVVMAIEVVE